MKLEKDAIRRAKMSSSGGKARVTREVAYHGQEERFRSTVAVANFLRDTDHAR